MNPFPCSSALYTRLRVSPGTDGMVHMEGTWPEDEAQAMLRAMARCERIVPGDDLRSKQQRDGDRFVLLLERVIEASGAISYGRAMGAA